MKLQAHKTDLKTILPLRNLFLQETNFQIRYNACHERGWTDSYLLMIDETAVGYGSIKGQEITDRDSIVEFYVIPSFRKFSRALFARLIAASNVKFIECQSNDVLLTAMLYEFAQDINADVVLFEDHTVNEHVIPEVVFRPRRVNDAIFEHKVVPVGEYVIESHGEVVATGGFMLHYNMPFADLYMEVHEPFRKRGLGSFILQELKKACYLAGRVPAARCNISNLASRAALLKAGLRVCGFMLKGEIKSA
jgi:GNAT superfamily N-acetyltransferase